MCSNSIRIPLIISSLLSMPTLWVGLIKLHELVIVHPCKCTGSGSSVVKGQKDDSWVTGEDS